MAADVATLKAQNGCNQQVEISHQTYNRGKSTWQKEEEDIDSPTWPKVPSRTPHIKMKLSRFEGGDPRGQILKQKNISATTKLQRDTKLTSQQYIWKAMPLPSSIG